MGHGDKKLCLIQQIKYIVPFSDTKVKNIQNTYYTCFYEHETDHTHTNPDRNIILFINVEDRRILNTRTKEVVRHTKEFVF